MGLGDWWKKLTGGDGGDPDAPPAPGDLRKLAGRWTSLDPAGRVAGARALATALGGVAGVAAIEVTTRDSDVDLRGTIDGRPFRIELDVWGAVEIQVRNGVTLTPYIDLEFDPEKVAPAAPTAAEPWDESEREIALAPGVTIDGSSARQEAAAFRALAPDLQARVLAMMASHRIRYFRSRTDELEADLHGAMEDHADPAAWIGEVLRLCGDVVAARVARRGGRASDGDRDDVDRDDDDDDDGDDAPPMVRGQALADALARRIPGAVVVARVDDDEVDVRWTEGGVPVRLAIDAGFDDVALSVRADDVLGSFELALGAHTPVPPIDDGDPWAVREVVASLAPTIYVAGDERDVRRTALLLGALPASELAELVRVAEAIAPRTIALDDERLEVTWGELETIAPAEALAPIVDAARGLARVAARLPREAQVRVPRPPICRACGAWQIAPRFHARCVRCAAMM